jgi:hypothetical protein
VSRVGLLLAQMDKVHARLRQRLEGLTDDEYFWEPVLGCWTIHRDESDAWVADYADPDPEPAPFTAIGWRLVHLADCKLTFPDLVPPARVTSALARLEEGHPTPSRRLEALSDRALDELRLTNWGAQWRPSGSCGR